MTKEELKCCDIPHDLHGTCCGWENAIAPCDTSMVITDQRHPGFGQPLDLWKHSYMDGSEDGYDITEKSSYHSGWQAGVEYAKSQLKPAPIESQEDLWRLAFQQSAALMDPISFLMKHFIISRKNH